MELVTSVHPSDETLMSYGKGELDRTVAESVQKHLEQCDACRRRVEEVCSTKVGPETVVKAAETKTVAGGAGQSSVGVTASWPIGIPPELTGDPHYEVMRELGRGGMGVVYLARNKLMDRLEVLKVLNKEMLAKHGTAERFLREIQSAAKLHHPNVVAAYTALQMGKLLVFAMEYVEGSDLARLVKTRGPLPVLNACYFALQAAQGLQHAHERGMIHRDIKPGNLILLRQGKKAVVKVLDFGLAKVTSEQRIDGTLTQQGQMLGTPDYIAPEQTLDAQKADIRADIYSLGCTLYHLLTGKPPFQGNSLYEVLQAHHSVDARPLNLVRPDVAVELAAVVAKMMAKEPKHRYQTPADVIQALRPFLKPGRLTSSKPELSPAASQAAQRWESLIDTPPLDRPSEAPRAKSRASRNRPRWLRPAAAMCFLILGFLGALAAGVFSANSGILVLQGLPEKSDVLVDGEKAEVRMSDEGAAAEITVTAGNRKIQVKKEGFESFEEEVSLTRGDKRVLPVRLIPSPTLAHGSTPAAKPGMAVAKIPSTPSVGAPNQMATHHPTVLSSSEEKTPPRQNLHRFAPASSQRRRLDAINRRGIKLEVPHGLGRMDGGRRGKSHLEIERRANHRHRCPADVESDGPRWQCKGGAKLCVDFRRLLQLPPEIRFRSRQERCLGCGCTTCGSAGETGRRTRVASADCARRIFQTESDWDEPLAARDV